MDVIDRSTAIRQGEELDLKRIENFLKDTIPGLTGDLVVEQFPSGFSNLTYLIRVGARELVLRRPPFGRKAKSAHDMGREYRVMSAVHPVFPYCPRPLAYTEDQDIIGCPFYVMERIKGIIPRKRFPKGMSLSPDEMRKLCERLLDVHVELHSVDYKAIGLDGLGKPEGYVRRQVEGWSDRYRAARTPDAPDFEDVMTWLHDKMPPDFEKPALIHNDYKFDNVVLDPDNPLKIIGVLDWEMATIGDPLMDLGSSLGYWVQMDDPEEVQLAGMNPTNLPGALTRLEMVQRYAEKAGITIDNFDFYLCFGIFRIVVILQQIYYRFYHGQTKDERFRVLIFGVHIAGQMAQKITRESTL
ncbi:MAG TPA: phosphotransferase family protein [Deltaproteobacteria bacterium]|nr:phosphotransferase family protein [Deltaproteobacteria bacterium]HPR53891.1 phosphotransferase family protein [Deltaproteobacteria bacterium]HXK46691.1 phosphotransferase family protein [Deltaproteobacteria bacterium]